VVHLRLLTLVLRVSVSPPCAGLLCYMLLLSGRSPSKILFTRDSGRVFQLDLLPLYGDKGNVERIEVVPYRLTRNLATFFTSFGTEVSTGSLHGGGLSWVTTYPVSLQVAWPGATFIKPRWLMLAMWPLLKCALCCTRVHALQGVFVPSQVAAASVLLSSSSNLQAVLCQFFREDLISWTSRKGKGAGGGSLQLPNDTLKGPVLRNTHQVRTQVVLVCMWRGAGCSSMRRPYPCAAMAHCGCGSWGAGRSN
jgi:hypothetical protein